MDKIRIIKQSTFNNLDELNQFITDQVNMRPKHFSKPAFIEIVNGRPDHIINVNYVNHALVLWYWGYAE